MSSNEELSKLIKSGSRQAVNELWEQVKKLCGMLSFRYMNKYADRCRACAITEDDLIQECFVAMTEAVQAYKPESGYKFNTYLNRHVINRFNELSGYRTTRSMNEPINNSKSLYDIVPGTEDVTLVETLPDDTATYELENAIEREYNRQLHIALDECMNTLTDNQRAVIQAYYYQRKNYKEICASSEMTYHEARKLHRTGLNKLRTNGICRKILEQYREEVFTRSVYSAGLTAFKYQRASIVEIYAERYGTN